RPSSRQPGVRTRAKFLVSAQAISFSLAHRYAIGCRQDVDWRRGRHPPCKDRLKNGTQPELAGQTY
ncbi:hypothetical protein, partial [Citrobacter freundii]|uniref:hypothetical protein n=1 Tax=Citrobacter freundii TaxID=546 RepID=UPI0019D1512C